MLHRAKKSLGQHFLNNQLLAEQIVDLLPGNANHHIIEIGPGKGILTAFLFNRFGKKLHLIELDHEFVIELKYRFSSISEQILEADALHIDLHEISHYPMELIGNFPYNISTQLMFLVLKNHIQIPVVVAMFQKEVAQRICAAHGSKSYGILSVLFQTVYRVEYMMDVAPNQFSPAPKVNSAVIRCFHKEDYDPPYHPAVLHQLVKMAFNQRRKMLRNSLKSLPEFEQIKTSTLMSLRPEQISPVQFEALALIISKLRKKKL